MECGGVPFALFYFARGMTHSFLICLYCRLVFLPAVGGLIDFLFFIFNSLPLPGGRFSEHAPAPADYRASGVWVGCPLV